MTAIEHLKIVCHAHTCEQIRRLERVHLHQNVCLRHPRYDELYHVSYILALRRRFPAYRGPEKYQAAVEKRKQQLELIRKAFGITKP